MSTRFKIGNATIEEAKDLLADELKVALTVEDMPALLQLMHGACEDDDRVELISQRRGVVSGTRVHIDIGRAAILSLALLLDAWKTRGISVGLLAMSGYDFRVITQLSLTDGTFCNFGVIVQQLLEADEGKAIDTTAIGALIEGQNCAHPNLPCKHRMFALCAIEPTNIESNVHWLSEKRCIVLNDKQQVIKTT